jgi:hypothetical protein
MESGRHLGRTIHDVLVGALAGFFAGFVLGLFMLRLVDLIAVPFTVGVLGSIVGGAGLERRGRTRPGVIGWRIAAWVVLVLAVGFIALLVQAIDDFS